MENKHNLYECYTSTSSLAGIDDIKLLNWSKGYFRAHYSKLLPVDRNANILEVACGYGRYLKTLSEMGYTSCFGIDISNEQILYAKNKLGLSNVEKADALDWLEGKEAKFDCILALDILEHLETEELLKLGKKMYDALKPGGKIIIQVPNGILPLNPVRYGDLTHVRAFTVQSMQQFFLHIGFDPVGYYEIPPYIHGAKSAIRRTLWMFLFKPILLSLMLILYGSTKYSVLTDNFIATAIKNSQAGDY